MLDSPRSTPNRSTIRVIGIISNPCLKVLQTGQMFELNSCATSRNTTPPWDKINTWTTTKHFQSERKYINEIWKNILYGLILFFLQRMSWPETSIINSVCAKPIWNARERYFLLLFTDGKTLIVSFTPAKRETLLILHEKYNLNTKCFIHLLL